MSLLTDIGLEQQLRTLEEQQTASAVLARRADEPSPDRRALRARAIKALWFGAKMVAGFVWWELILAKIIGQARVAQGRMDRFIKLARDFRNLAVELGGVWIKLGQFLSSRVDLLPPQIIAELSDLQDAVPPEPASVMLPAIERELGRPIELSSRSSTHNRSPLRRSGRRILPRCASHRRMVRRRPSGSSSRCNDHTCRPSWIPTCAH